MTANATSPSPKVFCRRSTYMRAPFPKPPLSPVIWQDRVRRQNIRDRRAVLLAECGPHLGLISRRGFCDVASAHGPRKIAPNRYVASDPGVGTSPTGAMLSDRDNPGISLAECQEQSRCVGVRFSCFGCGRARDLGFDLVVRELHRRRVGGWDTGVRRVAGFVRKPCAGCGALKVSTGPAWQ